MSVSEQFASWINGRRVVSDRKRAMAQFVFWCQDFKLHLDARDCAVSDADIVRALDFLVNDMEELGSWFADFEQRPLTLLALAEFAKERGLPMPD